jgi:preprotein translocase subunit SecF
MNFNIMKNRKTFYTLSLALVIASILLLLIKGFNYGIDFKGGNVIHVTFNDATDENGIKTAFASIRDIINQNDPEGKRFYFAPEQIVVQGVANTNDKEFIIQYPAATMDNKSTAGIHDAILEELIKILPYDRSSRQVSNVGPTIGDEMKKQGIQAAILSIIGILLYLGYRFDFNSAAGVVIAVVHDLVITLGFISLMNIEFDTTVLAAVLTLLGYSVNDSIVVFDRIRENKRISKNNNFSDIIDESINQSISRTLNTTITTLLALIALVLYGGASIYSFSIALTVGCIVGTYSSITIAAPCVLDIMGDKKRA